MSQIGFSAIVAQKLSISCTISKGQEISFAGLQAATSRNTAAVAKERPKRALGISR